MQDQARVLFIGGHDPSGGAGLQADLETATALGCPASSLITCLTTQDSHDVHALHPQSSTIFAQQFEVLTADIRPNVVKIGLLGDPQLAELLAQRLPELNCPVVLDPVLAAGGGSSLAGQQLVEIIRDQLCRHTTLLTPNRAEARRLTGLQDAEQAAIALRTYGCENVLLTGADESEHGQVRNVLFQHEQPMNFEWAVLPFTYHGSGCTLASSCACLMALGYSVPEAVSKAQQFTDRALRHADCPGQGQHFPNRRCHA